MRNAKPHSELHDVFRANVRILRAKANWSQNDLAERLKVQRAYIADIERGRSVPNLLLVERMAAALGVTPAKLLTNRPRKKSADCA